MITYVLTVINPFQTEIKAFQTSIKAFQIGIKQYRNKIAHKFKRDQRAPFTIMTRNQITICEPVQKQRTKKASPKNTLSHRVEIKQISQPHQRACPAPSAGERHRRILPDQRRHPTDEYPALNFALELALKHGFKVV